MSAATSSSSSPPPLSSSYRLKFDRREFRELLEIAKPRIIYKVSRFHYFAFDGFTMYCDNYPDDELTAYRMIQAIEFSNASWTKK